MTLVHVQAQLSPDELLKAVEQLDTPELEQFVEQVLLVAARRRVPSLAPQESALLQRINQGFPTEFWTRYDDLTEKREAENLTPDELAELIQINDVLEERQV